MVLFPRARAALKRIEDREWLLLALETAGVLTGILIAFELQEWGAQRDQASKHHQLMERLLEESENDISVIRSMRDSLSEFVGREQAFSVVLAKGQCPADRDFDAVGTTMLMPALTAPTSVYQELMGAGGLSSIERKDIREKLASFHYDLEWGQKQVEFFRTERNDPVPSSDPRRTTILDPNAEEPQVDTYDAQALCRDQGFKSRMAIATRNHSVFLSYFQVPLDDAIDVCTRLADDLGDKCAPRYGGPLKGADATLAAPSHGKNGSGEASAPRLAGLGKRALALRQRRSVNTAN
jgi:hypothetical protein